MLLVLTDLFRQLFQKRRYWRALKKKVCKSCRSRQELSHEYSIAKSASIQPRTSLSKFGVDSIHSFIRLLGTGRHAHRREPELLRAHAEGWAALGLRRGAVGELPLLPLFRAGRPGLNIRCTSIL